jgi:hypothetical protein
MIKCSKLEKRHKLTMQTGFLSLFRIMQFENIISKGLELGQLHATKMF